MAERRIPLFSVIIPVYNVEKYLRPCVDSVLSQDFSDLELILVDDGSTDSCPAICDGYAAHERVRVIHKENAGLSSARNAGMESARGEYLLFIDSDDFIAENALEKIADALKRDANPDVMFLSALMYYEDGRTEPYGRAFQREHFLGRPRNEALMRLSSGGQFHVSACVKAIKRETVNAFRIRFIKGIYGEDVDFSIQLYLQAATYSCCDAPYYYYRQNRRGSIMSQKTDKRFCDLLFIVITWVGRAQDGQARDREWIFRFMFHQYYLLIALYRDVGKPIKTNETKAALRQLSYLLDYTDNRKVSFLAIFCRVLGIAMTSHIIHLLGRG